VPGRTCDQVGRSRAVTALKRDPFLVGEGWCLEVALAGDALVGGSILRQSVRPVVRRAAELGLAWTNVPCGKVEAAALRLAGRAGADPELTRATVRSFGTETGPPAVAWEVALGYERPTQMWSLQRRTAP
jgi:hypothetical protein